MSDEKSSNQQCPTSRTALQDSNTESIDSKGGPVQSVKQIVEDKSQLILTILAMILAAFAIGQNFSESAARERELRDMTQIMDAKVAAGVAEARRAMSDQAAEAKAIANVGAQHARIALSEVERANAELAQKGLIKLASH